MESYKATTKIVNQECNARTVRKQKEWGRQYDELKDRGIEDMERTSELICDGMVVV